jgi:hypothetical protein
MFSLFTVKGVETRYFSTLEEGEKFFHAIVYKASQVFNFVYDENFSDIVLLFFCFFFFWFGLRRNNLFSLRKARLTQSDISCVSAFL